MRNKINLLFAILFLNIGIFSVTSALAEEHRGTVNIHINNISARLLNGSMASPKAVKECELQYASLSGSLFNANYSVDPQTGIESAAAQYEGKNTTLYPMGLAQDYGFMSGNTTFPQQLKRIVINVNEQFNGASVLLSFKNNVDDNIQCVLSGSE